MTGLNVEREQESSRRRDVLNLGSGRKHIEGAVNLDLVGDTGPDIVHDLNRRPWPLESQRFRTVHMYDVLEHLDDVTATLEEVHRVCAPGATVRITVPHYSCSNAFTDPTHRHYFGVSSLEYYTNSSSWSFYSRVRFIIRQRQLMFDDTLANKVVRRLANRHPKTYERHWAWIVPAWFIFFELEAATNIAEFDGDAA